MLGNGEEWEDGAISAGCDAKLMSLFQLEISWGLSAAGHCMGTTWALQLQAIRRNPGGIQEASEPLDAAGCAGIMSMSVQGKHSIRQDTKILRIRGEASRALLFRAASLHFVNVFLWSSRG